MAILKEDMMRAYQRYKFPETLKEEQLEITLSILNKKHVHLWCLAHRLWQKSVLWSPPSYSGYGKCTSKDSNKTSNGSILCKETISGLNYLTILIRKYISQV